MRFRIDLTSSPRQRAKNAEAVADERRRLRAKRQANVDARAAKLRAQEQDLIEQVTSRADALARDLLTKQGCEPLGELRWPKFLMLYSGEEFEGQGVLTDGRSVVFRCTLTEARDGYQLAITGETDD